MLTVLPCLGGKKWWLSSLKTLTFYKETDDIAKTKFSVEIFELWAKTLAFWAKKIKPNQTHSRELWFACLEPLVLWSHLPTSYFTVTH